MSRSLLYFLAVISIGLLVLTSCTADDPAFFDIDSSGPINVAVVGDQAVTIVDSDGDIISIDSVTRALLVEDYHLEAARGNLSGISTVNKYGRNIEVDNNVTADIWDGGHTLASGGVSLIWVAPTQSRIHNIVSTSPIDDGAPLGGGARTVHIHGLVDWDTSEVTEVITLDGNNNVATANSYVIIYRMAVLTNGATNINVGTITATAQVDGTITAQIRIGQGQTQMAVFGFPSTQTVYMGRLYANVNKAGGAAGLLDVTLMLNPDPDVELLHFLVRHTFGLHTAGTTALTIPYYVPKVFPGPGILKVQTSSSTNDMDVSAGFDLILIDN